METHSIILLKYSFIYHVYTKHEFEDIVPDVYKWFDTSNIPESLNRPLPIGIKKKNLK